MNILKLIALKAADAAIAIGIVLISLYLAGVLISAAKIDTACTSDGMLNHPCKHWQTSITFNFQDQQP